VGSQSKRVDQMGQEEVAGGREGLGGDGTLDSAGAALWLVPA